jgi:integrase
MSGRNIELIFGTVAREWWGKYMAGKAVTADIAWTRLERDALPHIGEMSLQSIDAPAVLSLLRRVEARGAVGVAYKLKSTISQVYRYAIACGYAYANPARDLSFALAPKRNRPHSALIEPKRVGILMRDIETYPVQATKCALRLLALTFVRPGELRQAEWTEVDIDGAEWRIPASRMKMRRPHIVPLSRQAIMTLKTVRDLTGDGHYVFPQARDRSKPMCNKCLNYALRRLGYSKDVMVGHGFRATASSLLAEQGWGVDAIERQLAHVDGNRVRASYHRSGHLDERRRMMQAWADFLDTRCAFAILGRG